MMSTIRMVSQLHQSASLGSQPPKRGSKLLGLLVCRRYTTGWYLGHIQRSQASRGGATILFEDGESMTATYDQLVEQHDAQKTFIFSADGWKAEQIRTNQNIKPLVHDVIDGDSISDSLRCRAVSFYDRCKAERAAGDTRDVNWCLVGSKQGARLSRLQLRRLVLCAGGREFNFTADGSRRPCAQQLGVEIAEMEERRQMYLAVAKRLGDEVHAKRQQLALMQRPLTTHDNTGLASPAALLSAPSTADASLSGARSLQPQTAELSPQSNRRTELPSAVVGHECTHGLRAVRPQQQLQQDLADSRLHRTDRAHATAIEARQKLADVVHESGEYTVSGGAGAVVTAWRPLYKMPCLQRTQDLLQAGGLTPRVVDSEYESVASLLDTASASNRFLKLGGGRFAACNLALVIANGEAACVALVSDALFSHMGTTRTQWTIHWMRDLGHGLCSTLISVLRDLGEVAVEATPRTRDAWKRQGLVYSHKGSKGFFKNTEWLSTHVQERLAPVGATPMPAGVPVASAIIDCSLCPPGSGKVKLQHDGASRQKKEAKTERRELDQPEPTEPEEPDNNKLKEKQREERRQVEDGANRQKKEAETKRRELDQPEPTESKEPDNNKLKAKKREEWQQAEGDDAQQQSGKNEVDCDAIVPLNEALLARRKTTGEDSSQESESDGEENQQKRDEQSQSQDQEKHDEEQTDADSNRGEAPATVRRQTRAQALRKQRNEFVVGDRVVVRFARGLNKRGEMYAGEIAENLGPTQWTVYFDDDDVFDVDTSK